MGNRGQDGQNMAARTGELGKENRDGTTMAVGIGLLGQDRSTGQSRQVCQTGQPVQVSLGRTERTGLSART
jgi:hypothetical protein